MQIDILGQTLVEDIYEATLTISAPSDTAVPTPSNQSKRGSKVTDISTEMTLAKVQKGEDMSSTV